MRIATWNCARGPWPAKRAAIASLGADVAIITEAPAAAARDGLHWFANNHARNGTTLIAGNDYHLEPLGHARRARCVNAIRVSGPIEFTVLLVWTWPAAPYSNYREPLLAGLRACRKLPGPFVIAGDFNGNVVFDTPRRVVKWADCFRAVEKFGVVSAYHAHFGEAYGSESRPTHYQTRNAMMPFHLDYVFVPDEWKAHIRDVRVPAFGEYAMSDHRPVVVDVDLPRPAASATI